MTNKVIAQLEDNDLRRMRTINAKLNAMRITDGKGYTREEIEEIHRQDLEMRGELATKYKIDPMNYEDYYYDLVHGIIVESHD